MAEKIRRTAGTEFGIAITGIAGPAGATKRKPVGTVFIALSSKKSTVCCHYRFKGTRSRIRRQAATESLNLLKKNLLP